MISISDIKEHEMTREEKRAIRQFNRRIRKAIHDIWWGTTEDNHGFKGFSRFIQDKQAEKKQ